MKIFLIRKFNEDDVFGVVLANSLKEAVKKTAKALEGKVIGKSHGISVGKSPGTYQEYFVYEFEIFIQ